MSRVETLEKRLRIAREYVFSADDARADKAANLIDRIKKAAKPHWDRRAADHKARADERFYFRTL